MSMSIRQGQMVNAYQFDGQAEGCLLSNEGNGDNFGNLSNDIIMVGVPWSLITCSSMHSQGFHSSALNQLCQTECIFQLM